MRMKCQKCHSIACDQWREGKAKRMALLYRFTKLNDRCNTGVFTFIVTPSVTRDLYRDATTKDFCYGYHRWAISFTRANDKVLGVYLILRNPSPNTKCFADFSLTLLNREHFSKNESFTEKQCKFTVEHPAQVSFINSIKTLSNSFIFYIIESTNK